MRGPLGHGEDWPWEIAVLLKILILLNEDHDTPPALCHKRKDTKSLSS